MKKAKILVVDDEQIARENLEHILKKEGYDVVSVDSGIQALKKLANTDFDLVLTDLKMKQVDGLEVLAKTKEQHPDTEVIMITAYATIETAIEAMQKGAYHYISKPYKIEEARLILKRALEKKWLKDELRNLARDYKARIGAPFVIGPRLLPPTVVSSSSERQEPARNWSPGQFTTRATAPKNVSSPSTVGLLQRSCSPMNSSATRKMPSPVPVPPK
jgi:CheY-like chemotaxis protein